MSRVKVTAARFRSMLTNRHMTVDDVASAVATTVNLHTLADSDLDVDFDDDQIGTVPTIPESQRLLAR